MPKSTRSKKKTDQKSGYESHKVKKLVLYVVGKNTVPLSAYDIQKNVVDQMPGYDQQKHTYTVLKQLVPHQQETPYELLFQLKDFFDTENKIKEIINDEDKNKLKSKLIRNAFKSYWFLLDGKEEDWGF